LNSFKYYYNKKKNMGVAAGGVDQQQPYVYVPPINIVPGLGEIRVQVEKPFYLPGETVNAKAYFMIGTQ
jgi:hypothetical protein